MVGYKKWSIKYEFKCPQCEYHYWVIFIKPISVERCPMCGCCRPIGDFIVWTSKT